MSKELSDNRSLENEMRILASDMVMYDKYEYPFEWKVASDKWNDLVGRDPELGARLLKEYGLI